MIEFASDYEYDYCRVCCVKFKECSRTGIDSQDLNMMRFSGRLRSGSSCQSHLRQDVSVACQPLQQDIGDKEQEAVFHRRARYRRV